MYREKVLESCLLYIDMHDIHNLFCLCLIYVPQTYLKEASLDTKPRLFKKQKKLMTEIIYMSSLSHRTVGSTVMTVRVLRNVV